LTGLFPFLSNQELNDCILVANVNQSLETNYLSAYALLDKPSKSKPRSTLWRIRCNAKYARQLGYKIQHSMVPCHGFRDKNNAKSLTTRTLV